MPEDILVKLFSQVLGIDAALLNEETSPDNTAQWDSRRSMELVAIVEDTFGVELSTKEIMKMRSIGIVRQVLRSKGAQVPDAPVGS